MLMISSTRLIYQASPGDGQVYPVPARADLVVSGYRRQVTLEPALCYSLVPACSAGPGHGPG